MRASAQQGIEFQLLERPVPDQDAPVDHAQRRVKRGEDLILECEEVRIFAAKREGGGIRAVPIPPEIRRLCEQELS